MPLVYLYLLINEIGTYTSYLAMVAVPGQTKHFLFNLGIFFAARNLGSACAYFAAGRLINRFSEKKCLIAGNVLSAMVMYSIMFSLQHIGVVAVLMLCVGFMDNLLATALNSYASKNVSAAKLLTFNHNLQVITYATMIIGATIGGSIIQYKGLGLALVFDGTSYLICSLIALFLIERREALEAVKPETTPFLGGPVIPNKFFILLGLEVCCALVVGTFNLIEIPYYLQTLKLQYSQIGLYFSVTIFGLLLAKYVAAKYKFEGIRLSQFLGVHFVYASAFFCLSFSSSLVISAVLLALFIGTLSITSSISTYFFQTWSSVKIRPKLLSLRISLKQVVSILIAVMSGYFSDKYNILVVMRSAFIVFAAGMMILFFMCNDQEDAHELS